jgi:hypothetical protein
VLKNNSDLKVKAIIIKLPKDHDKWYLAHNYEIHYQLINIKTAHRVGLLQDGKYLGHFAIGQDLGNQVIKLGIICGTPLLNGVNYGPGKKYQIEIHTIDNKIKSRSDGYFSILAQKTPKENQFYNRSRIRFKNIGVCTDLKTELIVIKNNSGEVSLQGKLINLGPGKYQLPSELQYIMNLKYPPTLSFAQTGVSEILAEKIFNTLAKGDFIVFNCSYQIPDFVAWGHQNNGTTMPGRPSVRRFTFKVIKSDHSVYKPDEECQPKNNVSSVDIKYLERKK